MLFLRPYDLLRTRVHVVKSVADLSKRKWSQFLNANDCSVSDSLRCTVLFQSRVDLAGAENDAFDAFRTVNGFAMLEINNNRLESRRSSEFVNWRLCKRVAKELFGE